MEINPESANGTKEGVKSLRKKFLVGIFGTLITFSLLVLPIYNVIVGQCERRVHKEYQQIIKNLSQNPLVYIAKGPEELKEIYESERNLILRQEGDLENVLIYLGEKRR